MSFYVIMKIGSIDVDASNLIKNIVTKKFTLTLLPFNKFYKFTIINKYIKK